MDMSKTGGLIAERRRELGLTQRELAERLAVSAAAVSKWERGLSFPDVTVLEPLGAALGLTAAELLAGARNAPPQEESLRSLLGLAGEQLRQRAKQQRRITAIILAAALLLGGLYWCWRTDRFPQRETVLAAQELPQQGIGELDGAWQLFDLTLADDFRDLTLQLEYWTEKGMAQSWELYATHTAGHGWARREQLAIALTPRMDEPGTLEVRLRLAHGGYEGSVTGLPQLGENGWEAITRQGRLTVDREEGIMLWCCVPDASGPHRPELTDWFDTQQTPQAQGSESFFVLRLLAESGD